MVSTAWLLLLLFGALLVIDRVAAADSDPIPESSAVQPAMIIGVFRLDEDVFKTHLAQSFVDMFCHVTITSTKATDQKLQGFLRWHEDPKSQLKTVACFLSLDAFIQGDGTEIVSELSWNSKEPSALDDLVAEEVLRVRIDSSSPQVDPTESYLILTQAGEDIAKILSEIALNEVPGGTDVLGLVTMKAYFTIPTSFGSISVESLHCQFRCVCTDDSCPAPLTVSLRGEDYDPQRRIVKCTSPSALPCSGGLFPGQTVAVLSISRPATSLISQQSILMLKVKLGRVRYSRDSKPTELERFSWPSLYFDLRQKIVHGKEPGKHYVISGAMNGALETEYNDRALGVLGVSARIGSFNVQLNTVDFGQWLGKWRTEPDADLLKKGIPAEEQTKNGEFLAEIVSNVGLFAVVESGFAPNSGLEIPKPYPNYTNIAGMEVGTQSRNPGNSPQILKDFHKFLKTKNTPRESLGVTYYKNFRVDGVLMFWDPNILESLGCLLYDQKDFQFVYPPYICQWGSKSGKVFITVAVHATPGGKDSLDQQQRQTSVPLQSDTSNVPPPAGDGEEKEQLDRRTGAVLKSELCEGLKYAAEFALRHFCPVGVDCPPVIVMGDLNVDALPNYLITLEKDQGLTSPGSYVFDGCFDSYGNICTTKTVTSFVIKTTYPNQNRRGTSTRNRVSRGIAKKSLKVITKKACRSKVFESLTVPPQIKDPALKSQVRPTTIFFLDNGKVDVNARVYDRMLLYNPKVAKTKFNSMLAVSGNFESLKYTKILPVLSDKGLEDIVDEDVEKIAPDYIRTGNKEFKFPKTPRDYCPVSATAGKEVRSEGDIKGWKTLVSDHFPIYLQFNNL